MKRTLYLLLGAGVLALSAACSPQPGSRTPPTARPITEDSVGYFCSMDLLEHEGPKGQIFVRGQADPLWFSTIRQTLAYTLLPDSPKGLDAIYVTDMGKASDLRHPGPDTWIDARSAVYVTHSRQVGGMGSEDPLPFGKLEDAKAFAAIHGGQVLAYKDIPEDYILHYDAGLPGADQTGPS